MARRVRELTVELAEAKTAMMEASARRVIAVGESTMQKLEETRKSENRLRKEMKEVKMMEEKTTSTMMQMKESAASRKVSSKEMAMNVVGTQNGLVPGIETNDQIQSQSNAVMESKEMKIAVSETHSNVKEEKMAVSELQSSVKEEKRAVSEKQSNVKGEKMALSEMQGAVDSYQRKSRKTMK